AGYQEERSQGRGIARLISGAAGRSQEIAEFSFRQPRRPVGDPLAVRLCGSLWKWKRKWSRRRALRLSTPAPFERDRWGSSDIAGDRMPQSGRAQPPRTDL